MTTTILAALRVDDLAARFLPMLVDATIKGSVLLALAGVTLMAMRRASAAARQLVLLMALASLLIMPAVSAALPGWQILPAWAKVESPAPATPITPATPAPVASPIADRTAVEPPARDVGSIGPQNLSPPPIQGPIAAQSPADATAVVTQAPAPPPTVQPPLSQFARFMPWAMLAWACGVVIFLLPLILGRISVWRLRRMCQPVTSGPLFELAAKARKHLGLKGWVALLVSSRRPMPMMWGILHPTLLLPAEGTQWSADRLWAVLLHELGHVKRRDMLTKLLANLAAAIYWFNPLVWLTFKRFQTEAERACDDLVLAAGSEPADYAQHILEIASGLQSTMFATHGSIAFARPSKLESRLLAILDPRRSRRRLSLLLILLAVLVGTSVVIPLSILRARNAADKPAKAEPTTQSDLTSAASGNLATQPAQDYCQRIARVVPQGWSVKQAGQTLVVRRDRPVEYMPYVVNAPAGHISKPMDLEARPYEIVLTFGQKVSADQFRQLIAADRTARRDIDAARMKLRHLTNKFDEFIATTDEDKKLLADYRSIQSRYHRLPDLYADDYAVTVTRTQAGFSSIADQKVAQEMSKVWDNLQALMQPTPAGLPKGVEELKTDIVSLQVAIFASGKGSVDLRTFKHPEWDSVTLVPKEQMLKVIDGMSAAGVLLEAVNRHEHDVNEGPAAPFVCVYVNTDDRTGGGIYWVAKLGVPGTPHLSHTNSGEIPVTPYSTRFGA